MINRPQRALILLSFTLIACTQPADDPKTVADKYWQHLQAGNTVEAEKLLTTNSKHLLSEHSSRINAETKLDNSKASTRVSTTLRTTKPATNYTYTENFNTVLVLQQGQWKIDISQSPIPPAPNAQKEKIQQLKEELTDSMQENMESIDNAMNEGMQMLNDALQDGSKEMGESLLHLMNELNDTMKKSIDKMKERRQQPSPQPQNQPNPDKGEGMI